MLISAADTDHGFTGITGIAADIMLAFGDASLALLVFVEMLLPPIPSEVILPFAGYLTHTGQLTLWGSILWSTLGAWVGALIYYWAGHAIGLDRAVRWIA